MAFPGAHAPFLLLEGDQSAPPPQASAASDYCTGLLRFLQVYLYCHFITLASAPAWGQVTPALWGGLGTEATARVSGSCPVIPLPHPQVSFTIKTLSCFVCVYRPLPGHLGGGGIKRAAAWGPRLLWADTPHTLPGGDRQTPALEAACWPESMIRFVVAN